MKIYQIKRFTGDFPKRLAKDPVVRSTTNLKSAQTMCINLNNGSKSRFYVQEIDADI